MSISSNLTKLTTDITNAYTSIDNKGGTIPANKNTDNLHTAINSIEIIEQATAEGESLLLTNTKAMPYSDYVVKGKSTQDGEPSPSNPSEIHSVADDVNLLNLENIENHSVNSYYYENIGTNFQLKAGETYTLSFDAESDITPFDVGIGCGSSGNYQSDILVKNGFQNGRISITFTPQNSNFTYGNYLALRFVKYNSPTSYTYSARNIKLQKGTTATPNGVGTVTIKQKGKNLLDLNRTLGTPSNTQMENTTKRTFYYNKYVVGITSNNYYDTSRITSYNVNNNNVQITVSLSGYGIGFPVELKANTSYTLSYDINVEANTTSGIGFYQSDGTHISYVNSNLTNKYLNFTTPSNCAFAVIIFRPPVNTTSTYSNIQLEEGSTATSYETYQTPHDYTIQTEPLRSLPNGVKDTLEEDGIHRRVGRELVNIAYQVTLANENKGGVINLTNKISKYSNAIICEKAVFNNTKEDGTIYENLSNVVIVGNSEDTLETLKTKYNGAEVLYELATETIEPLTQNQATTMLDIIKTGSYEGTTNIYTDEDVKPTIGVDYYKKA